jgi:hypothetical protein
MSRCAVQGWRCSHHGGIHVAAVVSASALPGAEHLIDLSEVVLGDQRMSEVARLSVQRIAWQLRFSQAIHSTRLKRARREQGL